jgi:prepilin-type N-terminal cleavage/methylation domain-containing protein
MKKAKKSKNKIKPRGFTLIEVLVAVCIFAVIVVGLGSTLNSGLKLWKKANQRSYEDINYLIEFEMLSKNIRQIFSIESIPVVGDSKSLQLPVIEGAMIFRNSYSYDAATKNLSLEKTSYEDILGQAEKVYEKRDCLKADSLSFSYLVYDLEEEAYLWQDEVEEESYSPLAIKITVERNNRKTEDLVFIPAYFY